MKNIDDFINNVIIPKQQEIGDKAGVAIAEILNAKGLPEESRFAIGLAVGAASRGAIEITLEILKEYHKWANQEP